MNVTGHTSGPPPAGDATPPAEGAATATGVARQQRPVSIRDVAAAASVSYQTVSRVINNHPSVKESTRAAVLAAISDLGFRPNRAARSLAGGRVNAVTVLTSDTTRYGYAASLQGIEEAARAAGFAMGIQVLEAGGRITDAVQRATEPGTALIVMAYDRAGTKALAAVPPGVPVAAAVETPSGRQAEGKPWVWLDDRQAAQQATRYLLGLGHRTVHYVPIPASTGTSPRLAGWRAGLQQAGAPVPELPAADGRPRRATGRAGTWPRTRRSPRCCAATTMSRSACCGPWPRGPAGPGQRQRGRLRRHAGLRLPDAGPDHRPAGLGRDWAGPVSRCCTPWSTRGPPLAPGCRWPRN